MPPKDPSFSPLPRPDDDAPDSDDHARLPDDTTALVVIVQDDAQPRQRREAAWSRLQAQVQTIAQRVCGNTQDQDLFCVEAVAHVWDRLANGKKFDPAKGTFVPWVSTVVRRFFLDFRLRQKRHQERESPHDEDTWPLTQQDEEDLSDLLMARRAELRRALDEIRVQCDHRTGAVDYHAVLLVQLRLAVLKCVSAEPDSVKELRGPVGDFIAWTVEWRPDEATRSFKPGWPSLSQLWAGLVARIEQPPHTLTVSEVCQIVNSLRGSAAGITPAVWNQWVRRAKQQARAIVGEVVWREVFEALLPDSPPRHEPSGGGWHG